MGGWAADEGAGEVVQYSPVSTRTADIAPERVAVCG